MKAYCDFCIKEVDVRIEKRAETYPVKGESISIEARACVCPECGHDLWVSEIDGDNLTKAYDIYRRNHGLMMPEQIKAMRERYGLSQSAFARLLGFGDKTITRYENGSIPDEAPNNLMFLVEDGYNFEQLFHKNKSKLTELEQKRVEKCITSQAMTGTINYSCKTEYDYNITSLVEYDFQREVEVS